MSIIRNIVAIFLFTFSAFALNAQAPKPNQAPVVQNIIPIQEVFSGHYFEFTIADNTFSETDQDDYISSYEAVLFNGDKLPQWIYFDAKTLKFWGKPEKKEKGEYYITIKAYDSHNAVAVTELYLKVN